MNLVKEKMETKKIVPIWAWIVMGVLAVSIIYLYILNFHSVGKEISVINASNKFKENNEELQQKKSIEKPTDLALSIDDFPSGWEIYQRGEIGKSEIQEYEEYYGWLGGYGITFRKTGENKDITLLQEISIYPTIENVSIVLETDKEFVKENDRILAGGIRKFWADSLGNKYFINSLGNVGVGDDSIAYKYVFEYGDILNYNIDFRKDKYRIHLKGYDLELMKELAKKIDDKFQ